MGSANSPDIRKVNRTVGYILASGRAVPAKIIAIGAGTSVTLTLAGSLSSVVASKRVNANDTLVWDNTCR